MSKKATSTVRSIWHPVFTSIVIVLLVLTGTPVRPVIAATITVTNIADDLSSGNGCSLREAIINANNDVATYPDCPAGTGSDIITLASGATYTLSLVAIDATGGDLDITDPDGLTIQASGTTPAIIDANDIDRVLEVTTGNLTLDYITVTNGNANSTGVTQGGGVFFNGTGILTINNSTISSNIATNGGNCGGGIFNATIATVNIINSSIVGNQCTIAGSDGGGIFKQNNGVLNITNSTLYNNSTDDDGGGVRIRGGIATISFSTFSNNSTANGPTNIGGAVSVDGGTVSIVHSILANSTAGNTQNDCNQSGSGVVTLDNTIVEVNSGCGGTIFSTSDPGLGAFQNNGGPTSTMAITSSSVAFDAATSCGSETSDQRGISRPQGAGCDIGAFELVSDTIAPAVNINQAVGQADPTNAFPINFTVVFSEAVTGFATGDVSFTGSTVGGTLVGTVSGGPTTYTVAVTGMTTPGDVVATIAANVATDTAGNNNTASTSTDNSVTYDATAPTVTINQAVGQADPTNASPVNFTMVFSEAVTSFTNADVTLSGTAGATTAVVSGGPITFNVAVSGMTGDGTVVASIPANITTDSAGNNNTASTSTDNTVTYNSSLPDTTIDSNPPNPSNVASATFTFSSPDADVVGFECRLDSGVFASCNSPQNHAGLSAGFHTFEVRAVDDVGNIDPFPASYTWLIDLGFPTVANTTPANGSSVPTPGPTQLIVHFSENVKNDGSAGAANNTVNYLLVEPGADTLFNTLSCAGGLIADDIQITVDSTSYTNNGGSGPFVATLNINGGTPLPLGTYRLFVCGTTSIEDLAGNELNNGTADTIITFTVITAPATPSGTTTTLTLPATGFPQDRITPLPSQSVDQAYASTNMWIEIPKLGVKMSIVGVPQTKTGWDVTWLNRDAGWLNGSAFPTWKGNSVITAHVWDALNNPGPFAKLKDLKYGDQIKVHAFGQVFVYEVRESLSISPTNINAMLKHEEKSWLTLITCEDYQDLSQKYSSRRLVRAVLVSVTPDK